MDTYTEKVTSSALVSVVMATYNRANYILEAITSVIAQTYQNWELIVVDDGSTDDTRSIVESFKDARIRYIKHDVNKGAYASRSDALAAAQGTYIAILDSDDVWADTGKLAAQVAYLERNPICVVVGTFITIIDANGNIIGKDSYPQADAGIRSQILLRTPFAHSSVLMRKEAVNAVGGYADMAFSEDLNLYLRLGQRGQFANIPEFMTRYRLHAGGIGRNALRTARAVHANILKYGAQYPNYGPALLKSYLRIGIAHLKTILAR